MIIRLDYFLGEWDNNIIFKIKEMDERFRGVQEPFIAKNGWHVASTLMPNIRLSDPPTIFLRGINRRFDNLIVVVPYFILEKHKVSAREVIKQIHEALLDWSQNWEGWEKNTEYTDDCPIPNIEHYKI